MALISGWVWMIPALTSLFSCAQTSKVVKNVQAYYSERLPGNIPADPTLLKRDSILQVYIQTTTADIKWDSASKGDVQYLIHAAVIDNTPHEVGTKKDGGEKLVISPAKGVFLWRIFLEPDPISGKPVIPNEKYPVLIKGFFKGKTITLKVDKAIELEAIPSV